MAKVRILSSVKRTGPRTVVATFKMPVAEAARNAVDEEIRQIRNCVVPIVGASARGKPVVMGSAVAMVYRGEHHLVTAHHVLENHHTAGLVVFASDGSARPFGGTFLVDKAHDLAARKLDPFEARDLGHIPFLPEDRVGPVVLPGSRFYATVTGYPSTAAKQMDRITLDTRMEALSNFAVEVPSGDIEVMFDKREGVHTALGYGHARDQYGKSGGAIFGIVLDSGFGVPTTPARLAGIATRWEWRQKRIRGASAQQLLDLLKSGGA